jgi:hypothetical protein
MGLAYSPQVWMTCDTSCNYTQPTQHHNKKHWQYDLPWLLASTGFNFIGECDRCMLCNWSQSKQHGDVIFIDETNIFFIILTIILQVLDRRAHKLKVSYFSAYLLFFLAVALEQKALTISIRQYFHHCCPLIPCHILARFWTRGAWHHCHRAFTHTQVPRYTNS